MNQRQEKADKAPIRLADLLPKADVKGGQAKTKQLFGSSPRPTQPPPRDR